MLTTTLFIAGFAALIKGADFLVDGASSVARRYRIPPIVIGLTIVAFGTSMPELFVNVFAALNGTADIAVGNIVGSNIVNILLILGVSALVARLTVSSDTVWKEIPMGLLAVVVLGAVANDILLGSATENVLTRGDGIVLIGFFIIFLYYTVGLALRQRNNSPGENTVPEQSMLRAVLFIGTGLAGLIVGGKWIVDGATTIAAMWGLSEAMIGLTIVAVGTSLPELATSAVAAYKGNTDIAIGNVAGSNIFNIFWILGISAIIAPLPYNLTLNFDLMVVAVASFLLFAAIFVHHRGTLGKVEGISFIVLYILYLIAVVARG